MSKRYTESHEWMDETGRVGVSEFAKRELGEIVSIELPAVGTKVEEGDELCVMESTKAAADVYAPISGRVVAVNEQLKSDLSLLNKSPEGEGWLVRLEGKGHETLMSASEYKSLLS